MLRAEVVEEIKTYLVFNKIFFLENRAIYEIMWGKYARVGQATYHNMAHALFMLDS